MQTQNVACRRQLPVFWRFDRRKPRRSGSNKLEVISSETTLDESDGLRYNIAVIRAGLNAAHLVERIAIPPSGRRVFGRC
mgnify:CR=1 FL=1